MVAKKLRCDVGKHFTEQKVRIKKGVHIYLQMNENT